MFSQRGFAPLIVLVIVLLIGGGVVLTKTTILKRQAEQKTADVIESPAPTVSPSGESSPTPSAKAISAKPTTTTTSKVITLKGFAYEDRSNNGIFDSDDPKLPIRDLHWYDTADSSVKLTFQTDASGNFSLTQRVLGNLAIEGFGGNNFSPRGGAQIFSTSTSNITIAFRSSSAPDKSGGGILEGDFFQDSNRNQIRDNGEQSIGFYKVYVQDSQENFYDASAYPSENGHFKYENLPLGQTYKIWLSNPTGEYIMDKPEMEITLTSTHPQETNIQIPVFKQ